MHLSDLVSVNKDGFSQRRLALFPFTTRVTFWVRESCSFAPCDAIKRSRPICVWMESIVEDVFENLIREVQQRFPEVAQTLQLVALLDELRNDADFTMSSCSVCLSASPQQFRCLPGIVS